MQRRTGQTATTSTDSRGVDPPKPSVPRADLPPGPSELPIIGQAFCLRPDLVGLLREAATYGDVSTVSVNPILICLVNHPELNREGLVTNHVRTGRGETAFETIRWMMGDGLTASTGPFHLKQRRLIQPRFAFFPFGGGPHQCIGEGFAWMEAKIALATLHRRWRATTGIKAEIMPRTTLKVKGGLPMTLERRN